MAKDPAILWYWSDWRGGTGTFTRHLKGCYMDVLDAQFNSGPLTIDEIRTVLGTDFGQAWPTLQKKFTLTNSGLFYNERMEIEREKRKKFTDSRRNNLAGNKKDPHMDNHMRDHKGSHMENENRNTNELGKDGGRGEEKPLPEYTTWDQEKQNFFDDGGWQIKFSSHKNISIDELQCQMREFIVDTELRQDFKVKKELQSHFTNLFNKQKNGRTEQRSGPAGKQGTSEARTGAAGKW